MHGKQSKRSDSPKLNADDGLLPGTLASSAVQRQQAMDELKARIAASDYDLRQGKRELRREARERRAHALANSDELAILAAEQEREAAEEAAQQEAAAEENIYGFAPEEERFGFEDDVFHEEDDDPYTYDFAEEDYAQEADLGGSLNPGYHPDHQQDELEEAWDAEQHEAYAGFVKNVNVPSSATTHEYELPPPAVLNQGVGMISSLFGRLRDWASQTALGQLFLGNPKKLFADHTYEEVGPRNVDAPVYEQVGAPDIYDRVRPLPQKNSVIRLEHSTHESEVSSDGPSESVLRALQASRDRMAKLAKRDAQLEQVELGSRLSTSGSNGQYARLHGGRYDKHQAREPIYDKLDKTGQQHARPPEPPALPHRAPRPGGNR